jgi:hypothetical protein
MKILYVLKDQEPGSRRFKVGSTGHAGIRIQQVPLKSPYKGISKLLASHEVSDRCEASVHAALAAFRHGDGREGYLHENDDDFLALVQNAVEEHETRHQKAEALRNCQMPTGQDGRARFEELPQELQDAVRDWGTAAQEAHRLELQKQTWDGALRHLLDGIELFGKNGTIVTWRSARCTTFDVERFRADHPELWAQYRRQHVSKSMYRKNPA